MSILVYTLYMKIKTKKVQCLKCGYEWIPRKEEIRLCANPKCRTAWFDKERGDKNE